jgi:hypothetical protein
MKAAHTSNVVCHRTTFDPSRKAAGIGAANRAPLMPMTPHNPPGDDPARVTILGQ